MVQKKFSLVTFILFCHPSTLCIQYRTDYFLSFFRHHYCHYPQNIEPNAIIVYLCYYCIIVACGR